MHTGTGFANGQMHTGTGSVLVIKYNLKKSASNCIPQAEVGLNLAVRRFDRKGVMGPGGGLSNEEGDSEYLITIV